jgi:DivIVA domain-containing protein
MMQHPPWRPPELAPEEIAGKRFRITWRGFDREEVRQFLAQAASCYESALAAASEAAVLRLRLSQAGLSRADGPDDPDDRPAGPFRAAP